MASIASAQKATQTIHNPQLSALLTAPTSSRSLCFPERGWTNWPCTLRASLLPQRLSNKQPLPKPAHPSALPHSNLCVTSNALLTCCLNDHLVLAASLCRGYSWPRGPQATKPDSRPTAAFAFAAPFAFAALTRYETDGWATCNSTGLLCAGFGVGMAVMSVDDRGLGVGGRRPGTSSAMQPFALQILSLRASLLLSKSFDKNALFPWLPKTGGFYGNRSVWLAGSPNTPCSGQCPASFFTPPRLHEPWQAARPASLKNRQPALRK